MVRKIAILTGILAAQICFAQAPAGAPAGSTAQCNDGTYFSGATKSGACSGHKGVKTWWGPAKTTATGSKTTTGGSTAKSSTPAPVPSSSPSSSAKTGTTATSSTPAPVPSSAAPPSKPAPSTSKTVAPGGGPGLVWLNTSTKVYHCYGGQDYGTTKAGKYLSEADAKAAGGRPAGGKACSK
jgi:hypothetical protein